MKIGSYPKVLQLGHPGLADLFADPVTIEEKVDGSQFSFAKIDGELHMRSKGAEIHPGAPDKMFEAAAQSVIAVADLLTEGFVYRAEYLQKPKHNTLKYDRIPRGHLIIFDVETAPHTFLSPLHKKTEAERIGFECIPWIDTRDVESADDVRAHLDRESVLGGAKVEGVVVKNYQRFGRDGKVLVGKYVSEAFKEVHGKEWKKSNPSGKDIRDQLGERYCAEGRWAKAVQHLRDAGQLTDTPRDIGALIKEVQADLAAEESEAIKAALFSWAFPNIQRAATRGLADWYKQRLLEGQFGDAA